MLNHYSVLELHSNGKNEEGVPYTEQEIKAAYRKLALRYHPDHNHEPDANAKFDEAKKSYDVLSDPQTRKAFDKQLHENPEAYNQTKHLFVVLEDRSEAPQDVAENNLLADQHMSGTDLTQLIINAGYSAVQIIKLSEGNIRFAQAILDNGHLLSLLSPSQQFELLMIIYYQMALETEEHSISIVFENPHAKQLLKKLIDQNIEHEQALITACQQRPLQAERFLHAFLSHYNGFSSNLLVSLSKLSYLAVSILITHYANQLRLEELEFIIENHFDDKEKIVVLYNTYANAANREKYQAYERVRESLKAEGMAVFRNRDVCKAICQIGMTAFSMVKHVEAIDVIMNTIDDQMLVKLFNFRVLNLLIRNASVITFNQTYTSEEQENLSAYFTESFRYFSWLNEAVQRDAPAIIWFSNMPVASQLLRQMNSKFFEYLLEYFRLDILENGPPQEGFIGFLLERTYAENGTPYFLELLLSSETKRCAWNCIDNNPLLLAVLLQQPAYQEGTANNETMSRKLALAALKQKLNLTLPAFQSLPQSFIAHYTAAKTFYLYINREPANKNPDIDYAEFERLFQKIGFFVDLFKLRTTNQSVLFDIITAALLKLPSCSKRELSNYYLLQLKLSDLLDDYADELVPLCRPEKTAQYLVQEIMASFMDGNYLTKPDLKIAFHLSRDGNNVISPTVAYQWLECFKTTAFKRKIHNYLIIFDGISWDDRKCLRSYSKNAIEIEDDREFDAYFDRLCAEYEEKLLPNYPLTAFSCFLSLPKLPQLQTKFFAYNELAEFLKNLQEKRFIELNDGLLNDLLLLLTQSGFDGPIFKLLRDSLKNGPELLSAVLVIVLEEPEFKLDDTLRKDATAYQANIKTDVPLELLFFTLAERHIANYRASVAGDRLVAMQEAHGDKIFPIIEQHGLKETFVNGATLKKVFDKIEEGANQFNHVEISREQIAANLLETFKTFALAADMEKLTNPVLAIEYHAELSASVKKNAIAHHGLDALLSSYPRSAPCHFLSWMVSLTLAGNELGKEVLDTQLNKIEDKKAIYLALIQISIAFIEQGNASWEVLEQTLGVAVLKEMLTHYINQWQPPEPIDNNVLDYFQNKLRNRTLTFQDLVQSFGKDISEEVVEHLYGNDLEPYFDRDDFDKVTTSRSVAGAIPHDMFEEILRKIETEAWSVEAIIQHYGKANYTKIQFQQSEKFLVISRQEFNDWYEKRQDKALDKLGLSEEEQLSIIDTVFSSCPSLSKCILFFRRFLSRINPEQEKRGTDVIFNLLTQLINMEGTIFLFDKDEYKLAFIRKAYKDALGAFKTGMGELTLQLNLSQENQNEFDWYMTETLIQTTQPIINGLMGNLHAHKATLDEEHAAKPADIMTENKVEQMTALVATLETTKQNFYDIKPYSQNTNRETRIGATKDFLTEITREISDKKDVLAIHRRLWKPIIGTVLVSLTGIGLFAVIGKAIYGAITKTSPLLFPTTSQKIATEVKNDLEDFHNGVDALVAPGA